MAADSIEDAIELSANILRIEIRKLVAESLRGRTPSIVANQ